MGGNRGDASGAVTVVGETTQWILSADEVEIRYESRDGFGVATDGRILAAIDTAITPELREEGIAREINRAVQDLRKRAGYRIDDRIQLELVGPVPEAWKAAIAEWALAELAVVPEPDAETELRVETGTIAARVWLPSR